MSQVSRRPQNRKPVTASLFSHAALRREDDRQVINIAFFDRFIHDPLLHLYLNY